MAKLGEMFDDVDRRYDDLYEEFNRFNDNQNNDEKERLLYKIKIFKDKLRTFEQKLKDMYIPKNW